MPQVPVRYAQTMLLSLPSHIVYWHHAPDPRPRLLYIPLSHKHFPLNRNWPDTIPLPPHPSPSPTPLPHCYCTAFRVPHFPRKVPRVNSHNLTRMRFRYQHIQMYSAVIHVLRCLLGHSQQHHCLYFFPVLPVSCVLRSAHTDPMPHLHTPHFHTLPHTPHCHVLLQSLLPVKMLRSCFFFSLCRNPPFTDIYFLLSKYYIFVSFRRICIVTEDDVRFYK